MKNAVVLFLLSFALVFSGCVSEQPISSPTPAALPSPVPSPSIEAPSPEPSPVPSPVVSVIPSPSPAASIPNITEFKAQVEEVASEVLEEKISLTQSWDGVEYYAARGQRGMYEITLEHSRVNNWLSSDSVFTAKGFATNATKQYKAAYHRFSDSYYEFQGTVYCFDWEYKLYFMIRQSPDALRPDYFGNETATDFLRKTIDICP